MSICVFQCSGVGCQGSVFKYWYSLTPDTRNLNVVSGYISYMRTNGYSSILHNRIRKLYSQSGYAPDQPSCPCFLRSQGTVRADFYAAIASNTLAIIEIEWIAIVGNGICRTILPAFSALFTQFGIHRRSLHQMLTHETLKEPRTEGQWRQYGQFKIGYFRNDAI